MAHDAYLQGREGCYIRFTNQVWGTSFFFAAAAQQQSHHLSDCRMKASAGAMPCKRCSLTSILRTFPSERRSTIAARIPLVEDMAVLDPSEVYLRERATSMRTAAPNTSVAAESSTWKTRPFGFRQPGRLKKSTTPSAGPARVQPDESGLVPYGRSGNWLRRARRQSGSGPRHQQCVYNSISIPRHVRAPQHSLSSGPGHPSLSFQARITFTPCYIMIPVPRSQTRAPSVPPPRDILSPCTPRPHVLPSFQAPQNGTSIPNHS